MPYHKGVSKKILEALKDGKPKSARQLQKELDVQWYSVIWALKDEKNKNNLVRKGCVRVIRNKGETLNRAQDMYLYTKGENFERCLRDEVES